MGGGVSRKPLKGSYFHRLTSGSIAPIWDRPVRLSWRSQLRLRGVRRTLTAGPETCSPAPSIAHGVAVVGIELERSGIEDEAPSRVSAVRSYIETHDHRLVEGGHHRRRRERRNELREVGLVANEHDALAS